MPQEIPVPAMVVLVGPSGSGKTTWAQQHFVGASIVSSDDLRGVVGLSEHDQQASGAAFEVLESIVTARIGRRLTTVIDTLGLDEANRARWIELAQKAGVPAIAVAFDTDAAECRRRNKLRPRPVPAKTHTAQIERFSAQRDTLDEQGFAAVFTAAEPIRVLHRALAGAAEAATEQRTNPRPLNFGLQISSFQFDGHPEETATALAAIAKAAERVGFTSLWVMDHFIQIPQVGRDWEDMLEGYTTLAYLAGVTETIELGTLVTGIGYRNPALLGKMIATLDVLSGGRAICGLGAGWFERETVGYGWDFEPTGTRFDRLEDTLQMLRLLWGPGTPSFDGKVFSVPEAICYPRPLRTHVPIMVGGGGEKRTLKLVAQYADMANLFGDINTVQHKISVLAAHCYDVGRNLTDIDITHLGAALVGSDPEDIAERVAATAPARRSPDEWAALVGAGTVEDHIGRLRRYADAGITTEIVNLTGLDSERVEAVERFAPIISAFS